MNKNLNVAKLLAGIAAITVSLFSSCVNTKNVSYFQGLSSAERSVIDTIATYTEPTIQVDDIITVGILTVDPQSAAVVNQTSTLQGFGTSTNISKQELFGFPVDKNGEIEIVTIGKVKVAGLTTYQAKELIRERVSRDYKDPNVSVRFANFKISVLGEVSKPATYSLPNEKVTILDVISLAGDLTLYGKRDNILVIRDKNGKKEFGRINLNSTEVFNNPYYYLKQNDVIYVEPNKAKVISLNSGTRTTLAVAISAISTIVLIFTRIL